jgi:hypothetical protein
MRTPFATSAAASDEEIDDMTTPNICPVDKAADEKSTYGEGYAGQHGAMARFALASTSEPAIGAIAIHPDGYTVEVVGEDEGCYFWHRVEPGTLARSGTLEAGPWRVKTGRYGAEDMALVGAVQRNVGRRDEIVKEITRLRLELQTLSDRDNAIVEYLTNKGRKAAAA